MSAEIQIVVNGESRQVAEGLGIAGLLSFLQLLPDRVAIERNLEILPRSQWASTVVEPGDRFEIVHLVGGGQTSIENQEK